MTQYAADDKIKERRRLVDQNAQTVEKNAYFNETIQNSAQIFSVNPLFNATNRQVVHMRGMKFTLLIFQPVIKVVLLFVFVSQVVYFC